MLSHRCLKKRTVNNRTRLSSRELTDTYSAIYSWLAIPVTIDRFILCSTLLEWCATHNVNALDPTAYFFRRILKFPQMNIWWNLKTGRLCLVLLLAVRVYAKRLVTIIKNGGYKGYLPVETLAVRGKPYDPFVLVPEMLQKLNAAIRDVYK